MLINTRRGLTVKKKKNRNGFVCDESTEISQTVPLFKSGVCSMTK